MDIHVVTYWFSVSLSLDGGRCPLIAEEEIDEEPSSILLGKA